MTQRLRRTEAAKLLSEPSQYAPGYAGEFVSVLETCEVALDDEAERISQFAESASTVHAEASYGHLRSCPKTVNLRRPGKHRFQP